MRRASYVIGHTIGYTYARLTDDKIVIGMAMGFIIGTTIITLIKSI